MDSILAPRESSGSLTSPSPSPPPLSKPANARKPSSSTKVTGLDSSSELSELSEDEPEPTHASTSTTSHTKDIKRVPRRKRSGIVPEPMWDWAYKPNGRKSQDDDPDDEEQEDDDGNSSSGSSGSRNKSSQPYGVWSDAETDTKQERESKEQKRARKAARKAAAAGVPSRPASAPNVNGKADSGEHGPNGISVSDNEDVADGPVVPPRLPAKDTGHESSPALTEDEDAHDHDTDFSNESEEDDRHEEENEDAPEDEEDGDEGGDQSKNVDIAPVVPLAPAGSSIMAGQQLIKTPSPSTSPEPEEDRDENDTPHPDKPVKDEPVELVTVADDAEMAERADLDADPDAEVEAEVEPEEADLELQPAHRAEALDVLAQIELRFALVREALYVEKMEELALEEAMIAQGNHPEMLHLQSELQIRHDRRLDLAAKRRKREDDHVIMMRKVEENGVWSWWKYERDELGAEMFAEANRNRRRLEREKRLLERPIPSYRVPQPPVVSAPSKTMSVADLFRLASLETGQDRANLKRKRKQDLQEPKSYPALATLTAAEIQNDIQQLQAAPRRGAYHAPMPHEIGPGIGLPPAAPQHYADYNAPPGSNRVPYHPQHQQHSVQPPPPMSSIHNPNARSIHGPAAPPPPHTSGVFASQAYPRPSRRSTSPFDHGPPVNGNTIYGMNGPGQHWAPVPPSAGSTSSVGAGASKINGHSKEIRQDGRERTRLDKDKERERLWHEGGMKEPQMQDELARSHTNRNAHTPSQAIPHHHHHVHRHNGHHHHLSSSSQRPPAVGSPNAMEHEPVRYANTPDQRAPGQKQYSSNPYWKHEEERERDRDRGRAIQQLPLPMNQLGGAPDRDRDLPTASFVMTPSQAVAAGANGTKLGEERENDVWEEGRMRYDREHGERERYTLGPPVDRDRLDRRSHGVPAHSRQGSNSTGLRSPRSSSRSGKQLLSPSSQPIPPPASGPGMGPVPVPAFTSLHSPARLSQNLAASPRTNATSNPERERDRSGSGSGGSGVSPPKGVHSISPLPHPRSLPSAYNGTPAGPGTPGSRLGTPGLAGPGTRPSTDLSPPSINGHPSHIEHGRHSIGLGITHGPGGPIYSGAGGQGLAGPAQPLMSPGSGEPGHMAPPKMTVVPLGNGS